MNYPLHHEDARPLYTTVDSDWLEELLDGRKMLQGFNTRRENLQLVVESMQKALKKHPKFCDRISLETKLNYAEFTEKALKKLNDDASKENNISAEAILLEEIAEMATQSLKGEKQKAKEECADCIAVLLRIMGELDG